MQQMGSLDGPGVVAIDRDDLAAIRGGSFLMAVTASLIAAAIYDVAGDLGSLAEGFMEGFAFARGG